MKLNEFLLKNVCGELRSKFNQDNLFSIKLYIDNKKALSFINYLKEKSAVNTEDITRNIFLGNLDMEIAEWFLSTKELDDIELPLCGNPLSTNLYKDNIVIAKINYSVYRNNSKPIKRDIKLSTILSEYMDAFDKFIRIKSIASIKKGAGKKLLQDFMNNENLSYPILLEAGYLFAGDYEEDRDVLNYLIKYYENIGFKNINNVLGTYEEQIPMLFLKNETYCKEYYYKCIENYNKEDVI